jgi:hypothetical protein
LGAILDLISLNLNEKITFVENPGIIQVLISPWNPSNGIRSVS